MALIRDSRRGTVPICRSVACPKDCNLRLIGSARRAAIAANLFNLVNVRRVLITCQSWRSQRSELIWRTHRPRSHVRPLWQCPRQKPGRRGSPLSDISSAKKWWWRGRETVGAAPSQNVIGDLLPPLDAASNRLTVLDSFFGSDRIQRSITLRVECGFLRRKQFNQGGVSRLNSSGAARCPRRR